MKATGWIGFLAAGLGAGLLAVQAQSDLSRINNYRRMDDTFSVGGQPTMSQLEQLKAGGFQTVINLRHPSEFDAPQEAAKANELGLRYIHIPVKFFKPTDAQVDEFLRATGDPARGRTFVHCTIALRVSAFWLIRRVQTDGWSYEAAQAEAVKISPHVEHDAEYLDWAKSYLARHPKK